MIENPQRSAYSVHAMANLSTAQTYHVCIVKQLSE